MAVIRKWLTQGLLDNKNLYSRMKFLRFSAIRKEHETLIHTKFNGLMV